MEHIVKIKSDQQQQQSTHMKLPPTPDVELEVERQGHPPLATVKKESQPADVVNDTGDDNDEMGEDEEAEENRMTSPELGGDTLMIVHSPPMSPLSSPTSDMPESPAATVVDHDDVIGDVTVATPPSISPVVVKQERLSPIPVAAVPLTATVLVKAEPRSPAPNKYLQPDSCSPISSCSAISALRCLSQPYSPSPPTPPAPPISHHTSSSSASSSPFRLPKSQKVAASLTGVAVTRGSVHRTSPPRNRRRISTPSSTSSSSCSLSTLLMPSHHYPTNYTTTTISNLSPGDNTGPLDMTKGKTDDEDLQPLDFTKRQRGEPHEPHGSPALKYSRRDDLPLDLSAGSSTRLAAPSSRHVVRSSDSSYKVSSLFDLEKRFGCESSLFKSKSRKSQIVPLPSQCSPNYVSHLIAGQFGGQIYSSTLYNTVQPRRPSLPSSSSSSCSALLASNVTRESIVRAAQKAAQEIMYKSVGGGPTKSSDSIEFPKLVRGQDVWLNQGGEQTAQILRCMQCGQSFKSLPMLTTHMIETKHYRNIVGSQVQSSRPTSRETVDQYSGEAVASIPCRLCRKCFSTADQLSFHAVLKHSKESGPKQRLDSNSDSDSTSITSRLTNDESSNGLIRCINCGNEKTTAEFVEHVRSCVRKLHTTHGQSSSNFDIQRPLVSSSNAKLFPDMKHEQSHVLRGKAECSSSPLLTGSPLGGAADLVKLQVAPPSRDTGDCSASSLGALGAMQSFCMKQQPLGVNVNTEIYKNSLKYIRPSDEIVSPLKLPQPLSPSRDSIQEIQRRFSKEELNLRRSVTPSDERVQSDYELKSVESSMDEEFKVKEENLKVSNENNSESALSSLQGLVKSHPLTTTVHPIDSLERLIKDNRSPVKNMQKICKGISASTILPNEVKFTCANCKESFSTKVSLCYHVSQCDVSRSRFTKYYAMANELMGKSSSTT